MRGKRLEVSTRAIAMALSAAAAGACGSARGQDGAEPAAPAEVEPEVEVTGEGYVYRGGGGLEVTIAYVESEDGEALVEVSGVDNRIDDVVLLHEYVLQGTDAFSYRTTIDGNPFHTLWGELNGEPEEIEVYLPGEARSGSQTVELSEESSAEIDPERLARRHAALVRDGTIADLEAVDRDEVMGEEGERFDDRLADAFETCGGDVPAEIEFETITDDQLTSYSVASYCGAVGDGIEELCEHPEGARRFRERVSAIRCEFGGEPALDLGSDGTLTWVTSIDATNLGDAAGDLARAEFDRDRVVLELEGGLWLSLDPGDEDEPVYFSEDGETFHEHRERARSAVGTHRYLFAREGRSTLSYEDDGAWTVTCGDREAEAREASPDQTRRVLEGAAFEDPVWRREPFALVRDDRGRYFYVDRLSDDFGGRGYRVFSGLRGAAEITPLRDVVDDSEGTIFSTADGELRLIIDAGRSTGATWIEEGEEWELTVLPVERNLELIYRDLGAYTGESFGTVCEHL